MTARAKLPITGRQLTDLLQAARAAGGRRVRVDLGNGASMDIDLSEQPQGPRTEADAAFEMWRAAK